MQIIDRGTLDQFIWPDHIAPGTRAMLSALVREGTQPFIANVRATVRMIALDGLVLPLVIVDGEPTMPNAYVCSPTTHYIDYTLRELELELAKQSIVRHLLAPIIASLRPLMRISRAERAVYVNNWLLSTNLYPPQIHVATLQAIHRALLESFPDHAIIYRSLNMMLNQAMLKDLAQLGYQCIFSRQVYLFDPSSSAYRKRNSYGNDRRLSQNTPYRWVEHNELRPHAIRMHDLYTELYIDKYSHYNPQLTAYFMQSALDGDWLQFRALERNGHYDGVIALMQHLNLITAPVVGYDRSVSQRAGLYRLLMFDVQRTAIDKRLILHLSSGAASFKRARAAEAHTEYSLVYVRHLPRQRRLVWNVLEQLTTAAIIPLMQRLKL